MDFFDSRNQPQHLRDYLTSAAGSIGVQKVRAAGLARWEVPGTGRLLDAGCGNGEVARELAALMPDAEVTAVDFSADAIAEAIRRHDGSRVKYEVGDLLDLPYEDNTFDGVRTERVIQHVADADRAIAELARVLRPGGRMCMIDTDWQTVLVDGSAEGVSDHLEAVLSAMGGGRPAHGASSGRTLRRRMIQAGLTDVRAEPITGLYTDLDQARQVLPLVRDSPMTAHLGPHFIRLMDGLEKSAADGTFLLTLTMWVVVGTRAR